MVSGIESFKEKFRKYEDCYALERMFAILGRRVGKRTLMALKDTVNEQPVWLQVFSS